MLMKTMIMTAAVAEGRHLGKSKSCTSDDGFWGRFYIGSTSTRGDFDADSEGGLSVGNDMPDHNGVCIVYITADGFGGEIKTSQLFPCKMTGGQGKCVPMEGYTLGDAPPSASTGGGVTGGPTAFPTGAPACKWDCTLKKNNKKKCCKNQ